MNDNYKKRISSELNNCLTDTSFLKGKKKTGKVRTKGEIKIQKRGKGNSYLL